MSLKAGWGGSDKKEDIEILIDRTKCFLGFVRFWRIELIISCFKRHECQIVETIGRFLYWGLNFLLLCKIPYRATIMDQWSREWWKTLRILKATLAKNLFCVFNVFGMMWYFFDLGREYPTYWELRVYIMISTSRNISWASWSCGSELHL
jgi:hypothetical protein